MFKKFFLVIVAIAAIAVVGSLYLDHKDYVSHRQKFDPAPNLNPKYFVVAHGHIALSLLDKVSLSWKATYISHNPKCQYYPNSYVKFEGVPSDRAVVSFWNTQVDANGNYQVKIPLDKYLPGYCQWSIMNVILRLNGSDRWYVSYFDHKPHKSSTSMSNTYLCSQKHGKLLCKIKGTYDSFNDQARVNPNQSYNVNLNMQAAS